MDSGCNSLRRSEPHFGNVPLKSALLESNEEISYQAKLRNILQNIWGVFLKRKAEELFRSLK